MNTTENSLSLRINESFPKLQNENGALSLAKLPQSHDLLPSVGIVTSMTILSLLILFTNAVVLAAYAKTSELQIPRNYYVISLAVSDLITGLINVNVFTVHLVYIYWPLGILFCSIWLVLDFWLYTVSLLLVFTIAIDRFVAVYFPMFHRVHQTEKNVKIIIFIIWVVSFLVWAPIILTYPNKEASTLAENPECDIQFLLTNVETSIVLAIIAYYGPIVVMTFLYLLISRKLTKRKNKIMPQPSTTKQTTTTNLDPSSSTSQSEAEVNVFKEVILTKETKLQTIKAHKRGLRLLLFVLAACAIAWFPYHISVTIETLSTTVLPRALWVTTYVIGWSNALLDPFCYAIANKQFKKAVFELFKK